MSHPKNTKIKAYWLSFFFWEAIHRPDPCRFDAWQLLRTWNLGLAEFQTKFHIESENDFQNGISSSKGSIFRFHVRFSGAYASDKTCDHLPSLPCLTYISHREVVEEDHYPPIIKAKMGTKIIKDLICHNHDGI